MTPESVLRELEGLRALARSLVRGDAEADDLVQDTAIAAITHPPDEDRPVRPWLATVLRNRWRMNRRAEARRKAREQAAQVDADDPVDTVERARVLERLSGALVALDEPYRTTVIRRYLDGHSAAEIARALGIPPGTVRWRLKTGLDRLRAALDETTPRWQRALVPIAAAKGALLVKTKTTVIAIVALLLLLGGGIVFLSTRGGGRTQPAPIAAGSGRAPPAIPRGPIAGAGTAAAPVVDPLPGQGRAKVEIAAALPGGAVTGRVINWSTGAGVAGAELTFSGRAGAATIRSRDDGAFELAPEAPGAFELTAVVAAGFLPYAPELAHSPVSLVLAAGHGVRGITVFLFPAVDYHGVVVDAAGAPVAGARVALLGTPAGEQTIEKLATEWTTDAAGAFTFHAPDGAVLEAVHGKARGWGMLTGDVAITHELKIALGDAPPRDATIRGITVDPKGAPLADVLVRAEPDDPPGKAPDAPRAVAFATSGPDGAFVLAGLDRGPYALSAELAGLAPTFADAIAGGTAGVKLVLDAGVELAGTVATAAGEVVPAFTLIVAKRQGALRVVIQAPSVIDPAGRFRVRVPPGGYELQASASGLAPSAPVATSGGQTDLKLVVTAGATLRGVVVAADRSGPLPRARIMREGGAAGGASTSPANAGTVTRDDGTFELTGIPPGPLSIMVAAGNYHPKIEAGMTAVDGGELGPLTIALTAVAAGDQPTLELVGIGVKLAPEGDTLRVDGVFPDSGAAAAGIVVGDRVIAVDGIAVATLGLDGAIGRIRGQAGTTVAITLRRGEKPVQLVVARKKLHA